MDVAKYGWNEVARAVRGANLYEARVSLERSLAQLQKGYGAELEDEEVIRR